MRTSALLEQGQIVTRQQLQERFDIVDKTLYTGIFKPRNHDSIWLFITETKPEGMTEYRDELVGDTLYWEGQTSGTKDLQIVEHAAHNNELVIFYRPTKDSYPASGFRFEGVFEYVSHKGAGPSSFVLRRSDASAAPSGETMNSSAERAPTQPETCLIDVLAKLRHSGRDSVVAQGCLTDMQRKMHVPDAIEDWTAERIARWRADGRARSLLVVLSGNAGDGKSDLIERLCSREGIVGADTDIVSDATHAESPSQSQAQRLLRKLSPFSSDPDGEQDEPRCVLIAMNVGMVIAFFDSRETIEHQDRFARLKAVLQSRLGLSRAAADPPEHWECEVVNLDHRNLLGRDNDGLFAGMLTKLDPEDPASLTHAAALACASCPARAACWVRSNLNLLRLPAVKQELHQLLWEVTLGNDVHLSPRNVWDVLFHVTTGGLEIPMGGTGNGYLSCDWMRDNLSGPIGRLDPKDVALIHRRLLYHLLFEPASSELPSRGPLLAALAEADPIKRGAKQTHLLEGRVRAAPAADSDNLSFLASQCGERNGEEGDPLDPLLDGLAGLANDPDFWSPSNAEIERIKDDLALGVSRRARVTGVVPEVQAEVSDPDVGLFLQLLHNYLQWQLAGTPPKEILTFWSSELVAGVSRIFGVDVQGKPYFRLDSLSPATRFPAYVPVNLKEKLLVVEDPVATSGAAWLDAVAYLPRSITATIDTGGSQPWAVPVDLQLYRLLAKVNQGYSASSVDLDTFFRLRYACERLGATDASGEIVFKSLDTGELSKLEQETVLGGLRTTTYGPV